MKKLCVKLGLIVMILLFASRIFAAGDVKRDSQVTPNYTKNSETVNKEPAISSNNYKDVYGKGAKFAAINEEIRLTEEKMNGAIWTCVWSAIGTGLVGWITNSFITYPPEDTKTPERIETFINGTYFVGAIISVFAIAQYVDGLSTIGRLREKKYDFMMNPIIKSEKIADRYDNTLGLGLQIRI